MTSKIKNAVTKAIHNLFGDDYAVYTAYTEQGFSEPCFIVEMFPLNVQSTNSFLDDENTICSERDKSRRIYRSG